MDFYCVFSLCALNHQQYRSLRLFTLTTKHSYHNSARTNRPLLTFLPQTLK